MRSSKNYPSPAIVAIVVIFIIIATFASVERESLARKAALGGNFVDMVKIKEQVRKGNLSEREADFYRIMEVDVGY